ncbi:hypothetical protein E4U54_003846 [Claviceps lovelessii]|nr:hypothetical protein E4U54_003846 [Claviceps lovelessii]
MKRDRLSFLKKSSKRTVSRGTLDRHSETLRSGVSLSKVAADGGKDQNPDPFHSNESSTSLRLSKDEDDSVHSSSKKGEDETPPTSPDEHHRKSGLFNRWKRN